MGEVVLKTDLPDLLDLRLEPIDVLFLIQEDLLEERARTVIPVRSARLDSVRLVWMQRATRGSRP